MSGDCDPSDSLPTRPSLLGRLANLADDRSWRDFYLTYEVHIRAIARRHGLSEPDAEEVAQDVLRRVAQTIHEYRRTDRRGAFRRWLFQLTHWRATDRLRHRKRTDEPAPLSLNAPLPPSERRGSAHEIDRISSSPALDRTFELEAQRYVLHTLLARLERSVSRRNLQIFQMVMLDEVPVPRVAELFRTRPSAVYLVKHRVLEKLRAEVAGLEPLLR
jgi:RNA polymerase sigma factor, sigma-70 family